MFLSTDTVYRSFSKSQGAFEPDPKVFLLLELIQRHIVADADDADAIAIDIIQRTTNGRLVLAVK